MSTPKEIIETETSSRYDDTMKIEAMLKRECEKLFGSEDLFSAALDHIKTQTNHSSSTSNGSFSAGDEKTSGERKHLMEKGMGKEGDIEKLKQKYQSLLSSGNFGVDLDDIRGKDKKFGTLLIACTVLDGSGDLRHYISFREVINELGILKDFNVVGFITGMDCEENSIIPLLTRKNLLKTTEVVIYPSIRSPGEKLISRKAAIPTVEAYIRDKKEFREKLEDTFAIINISTPLMREILHPIMVKIKGKPTPICSLMEHGGCATPSFEDEDAPDPRKPGYKGYISRYLNSLFYRNMGSGSRNHGHFLSLGPIEKRDEKSRAEHLSQIKDMKFMNRLMGLKGDQKLKENDEKRCAEFLKTRHIIPCFCQEGCASFVALVYGIALSPLNTAGSYEEIIFVVNENKRRENFHLDVLCKYFIRQHKDFIREHGIQITFISSEGQLIQKTPKSIPLRHRIKIIEYKLESEEDYQHLKGAAKLFQVASGDNSLDEGIDSEVLTLIQSRKHKIDFIKDCVPMLNSMNKNNLAKLILNSLSTSSLFLEEQSETVKVTPLEYALHMAVYLASLVTPEASKEFQEFSEFQREKNNLCRKIPFMLLQNVYYSFLTMIHRKNPKDPRIAFLKKQVIMLEAIINEQQLLEFQQVLNAIDNSEDGSVDLRDRNFTPSAWLRIFEHLNQSEIRELMLEKNAITLIRIFPNLVKFISKNAFLKTLGLGYNFSEPKEIQQLFLCLHREKNTVLERLDLTNCGLTHEALSIISAILEKGTVKIKYLTLTDNNIDGKAIPYIKRIMQCKQLEILMLDGNPLNINERMALAKMYLKADYSFGFILSTEDFKSIGEPGIKLEAIYKDKAMMCSKAYLKIYESEKEAAKIERVLRKKTQELEALKGKISATKHLQGKLNGVNDVLDGVLDVLAASQTPALLTAFAQASQASELQKKSKPKPSVNS